MALELSPASQQRLAEKASGLRATTSSPLSVAGAGVGDRAREEEDEEERQRKRRLELFSASPYAKLSGEDLTSSINPPQASDVTPVPVENPLLAKNDFAAVNQNLHKAGEDYRNMPFSASMEERAAAREGYADLLRKKADAVSRIPRSEFVVGSEGATGTQGLNPEGSQAYQNELMRQGIDPYSIGSATLRPGGGLDNSVSVNQEYDAKNRASRRAHRVAMLTMEEMQRRRDNDFLGAAIINEEKEKLKGEYGLVDTGGGISSDLAKKKAVVDILGGGGPGGKSSLSRLAQERTVALQSRRPKEQEEEKTKKEEEAKKLLSEQEAKQMLEKTKKEQAEADARERERQKALTAYYDRSRRVYGSTA